MSHAFRAFMFLFALFAFSQIERGQKFRAEFQRRNLVYRDVRICEGGLRKCCRVRWRDSTRGNGGGNRGGWCGRRGALER